jgi:hypothetical protein
MEHMIEKYFFCTNDSFFVPFFLFTFYYLGVIFISHLSMASQCIRTQRSIASIGDIGAGGTARTLRWQVATHAFTPRKEVSSVLSRAVQRRYGLLLLCWLRASTGCIDFVTEDSAKSLKFQRNHARLATSRFARPRLFMSSSSFMSMSLMMT